VLQCVAERLPGISSKLCRSSVAVVLQCVAVCCSVLRCVAEAPRGTRKSFLLLTLGPRIQMSHFTHINASCHTYKCVMAHTRIACVTHTDESSRTS